MQSIFRYPGGKTKVSIQQTILRYKPAQVDEYREPFVGGGGIFFAIGRSTARWINDINPGLISVYKALQERPESFIAVCREIAPMAEGEEEVARQGTGKMYNKRLFELFERFKKDELMDPALRYFYLNRTVWGGRVIYDPERESRLYYSNPAGWNIVGTKRLEEAAKYLVGVKITQGDYRALLRESGTNVWVYLDPPYIVDTEFNKGSKLYDYGFSWEDHRQFVDEVKASKHKVCISYDDRREVREWFRESDGFRVYSHEWNYCGSSCEEKKVGRELLILNYEPEMDGEISFD